MSTPLPLPPATRATAVPPRLRKPPRTGLTRISAGLLVGSLGWLIPSAAAGTILLPTRIENIDPANKVALLALITVGGSIVALISNIVLGGLSDVTRSRLGARTPWILIGGVGTAVFFVLLAFAQTIPLLLLFWCGAQFFVNATVSSLAAILPDRVPINRRATASVALGLGTLIGNAGGTIVGAQFIDTTQIGFLILAACALVLPVVAVVIAPDRANRDQPGVRPTVRWFAASLRPPRKAPDFYWALWGRLALVLGYFMINGYQLYILTDYIGLSREEAAGAATVNSLLFLVAALVGVVIAGPLSDRTGRRKGFILFATVLFVVAIFVPMVIATVPAFLVFFIVGGLGFGAYYAVDAALMTEVLPSEQSRAKDLGILNIANSGGQILAPAATSAIIAIGLGFTPVFAGALLACLAGGLMVLPIKSVK